MAKNTNIEIVEEVTTAIRDGKDICTIKTTNDGRGVRVENKSGSIFFSFGSAGKAIVDNLKSRLDKATAPSKGLRRSRASIVAQNGGDRSKGVAKTAPKAKK